ncbi:MAG: radical SAM protein [Bradymonadales bacterium]|nr:radical SAM protein [Bradymonadales bacterium]
MVFASPNTIYLEITDRCNMACPMCSNRSHRERSEPILTRRQIRDQILAPCRALGMANLIVSGGEPTLCPHLLATIKDAVALSYQVVLATNLLASEARLGKLVEALRDPGHCILVSFDSIVSEEMNRIRGGAFFDIVKERCLQLVKIRNEWEASTRLLACIVLMGENAASVGPTIDFLLDQAGYDEVVVQPLHPYQSVNRHNYRSQPERATWGEHRDSLIVAARKLFLRAESDPRVRPTNQRLEDWLRFFDDPLSIEGVCRAPTYLFIDAYGLLRGCLMGEPIGRIQDGSITELLGSPAYQEFLQLSQVCKICIHGCC